MLRVARVLAAPADTMMLLGDICQGEELRKRPGNRNRGRDRQIPQPIR